ncbi:MAG: MotA/TolQ/ExbB proton channel family protein [Verrucomicrobiae bacterium]|nr:MotA/TolQ/ExbB proton channel family protein [Verrucomicrobiae bacterium]
MNLRSLSLALAAATFAAPLHGAQPSSDVEQAAKKLVEVQREYSDLRRGLYREINKLDDQALSLGKQLKDLDRQEQRREADARSLEREIEARKTEINYAAGILNQYSKALATRLHPAENQLYQEKLGRLDQQAANSTDEPNAEIAQRLAALELGIRRIGEISGGQSFEGKALRNGSEAVEGKLLLTGPAVFFSAKDGGFEGVATFADSGTPLPTVVAIRDNDGAIRQTLADGSGMLPLDATMGKAIEVAAARDSIFDTIRKGGYVGYAILALGTVSFLLAIFKVFEITRLHVPSRTIINSIIDDLLDGNQGPALRKAETITGPCRDLVVTGVERFNDKRRVLEEALFEKLVTIKPRLDRFLPFMGLTAAAAPLMGLLGTVLGIIKTFQAMALYGTGNAKSFSAGISEALITTAQGLIVAIPVLVVHGLLKSLSKGRYGEIEGIAIALVNGTTEKERKSDAQAAAEAIGDDDDIELAPASA